MGLLSASSGLANKMTATLRAPSYFLAESIRTNGPFRVVIPAAQHANKRLGKSTGGNHLIGSGGSRQRSSPSFQNAPHDFLFFQITTATVQPKQANHRQITFSSFHWPLAGFRRRLLAPSSQSKMALSARLSANEFAACRWPHEGTAARRVASVPFAAS